MSTVTLDQYTDITQWRAEDIPFLDACWVMLSVLLEGNEAIHMHKAVFSPVHEDDDSVDEVTVDWQVRESALKLCMGRETCMVLQTKAHDQEFRAVNVDKFLQAMSKVPGTAREVLDQIHLIVRKFVEWGYVTHVSMNGTYPIPLVVFTKDEGLVRCVGMMEYTPRGTAGPTVN